MLQRIQSVYLLLIALLMAGMIFLPLAVVVQAGETLYALNVFGVRNVFPAWGLFALAAIVALLSAGNIFLFRKRVLQIRICVFNAILLLGFYGYFAFVVCMLKNQADGLSFSVKLASAFPLVSLILDYLAIRGIGADEVLLRSLNRLR
jgi:hypothetical protein